MARKRRLEVEGGLYHLITRSNSRGNWGQAFYFVDSHAVFWICLKYTEQAGAAIAANAPSRRRNRRCRREGAFVPGFGGRMVGEKNCGYCCNE
ncbi:hypothetical protein BH10ACI3_BH10ACI3_16030 [soil metagenome]